MTAWLVGAGVALGVSTLAAMAYSLWRLLGELDRIEIHLEDS